MLKVKKDYKSLRNTAYTVKNTKKNTTHSVLYKKDKDRWCCDCTWNSLKETPCSHIKAVIKKKREKEVKKLIKKLGI